MEKLWPTQSASLVRLLVLLLLLSATEFSNAQGLCKMSGDDLRECRPAITAGSTPVPPTTKCCLALHGADMNCLCAYKNSNMLGYFGIDPTLAMALPTKCSITPPPQC